MKKTLIALLLTLPVFVALFLNLSCSTNTPTAATNFQNPVQTIVAVNPTLTFTPTFTFTSTPTLTPTGTPTTTPTPFATTTWSGFNAPSGLAVDSSGNAYVADTGNNTVEKYGSNGLLSATWGSGAIRGKVSYTSPLGVAVDGSGDLYVVGGGNQVSKYDPSGNLLNSSFSGASLTNAQGVAVNSAGSTIFVADAGAQKVVELSSAGVSLASSFSTGVSIFGIAVDSSANVFVSTSNTVRQYSGGSLTTTIPGFVNPTGLAVDSGNNLYVADTGNRQIEGFAASNLNGVPFVIFNNGGQLVSPKGVGVDSSGNIYVADSSANDVVKFAP